jgi:hypothetical protein
MSIDFTLPPELVEDQSKAEELLATILQMTAMPGWLKIRRIIQHNIELIKEQAFEIDPEPTAETMKRLRDRLFYLEQMRDLPEAIVAITRSDEKLGLPEVQDVQANYYSSDPY